MKKAARVVAAIILFLGMTLVASGNANVPVLAEMDFSVLGIGLQASPDYQAVPKGIASKVNTAFVSGNDLLPADVVRQLPADYKVKAELTGPSLQTPIKLTTSPGVPFDLPTLPLLGKYSLGNIRLVDGSGQVLFGGTPQAVTIESIGDPLVTSVTTRPLSLQELQSRGVTFDSSNFTAYEFTAGIGTQSGQVPLTLPVIIPTSAKVTNPEDIPPPTNIGIIPPPVENTPPDADVPPNLTVAPFMMEVEDRDLPPDVKLPPIPGIVVIPGNIGFLHQYFSALALVTNGAPGNSDLVVKNLKAAIKFPSGEDLVPGTDAAPGDDPIRMAKGASGFFQRELSVMNAGPDKKIGTDDDISLLHPAESGQADFTIEGLKEGTHKLDFDITATLEGLPIGPVTIKGKATGAVLVRNPDFTITLGHPSTVRSGEAYDLFITVTNTSKAAANLVSVHLDPRALSGSAFAQNETSDKSIETILPGSSETVRFKLVSQRTGKVTATAFESEDVKGRFILRAGVGELGIPLSPDSLILPYTGGLPNDLVEAAVGLLGQAWSVATAPSGALPTDVLPIGKQIVSSRAFDLSEAGLRVLIGDSNVKAVEDLTFDIFGSDNANAGFDALRRKSTQGVNLNRALASVFQGEVQANGLFGFQAGFADKVSYRPGHISVVTGEAPVRVQVSDDSGQKMGGLVSGNAFRDIPYADQVVLSEGAGGRSTLSLVTKLNSTSYKLELNADADAFFDMGIVLPDSSGVLRQYRFAGVSLPAGSRGWLTLQPGTNSEYVLNIDTNGDGSADATATSSFTAIPDHAPHVVAATQIVPGFGPGGDKHGRNVAVLFSERVTKETAQDIANYSVDENAVKTANLQPGSRMVFLLLRDGIGPFFDRKLTVSGLKDTAGNSSDAATLPIRITAQGPAAVVAGTVRTAKGEPISGAAIRLLQYIWFDDGFTREPRYALFSEKSVDSSGHYQFDYVLQNDDPQGPFMLETLNSQSGEAGQVTTGVLFHGQRINLDLFMKARGSLSGKVFDASGNPVSNATVQVITLNDSRSYMKTTDASGSYSFSGLSVGSYNLKAVSQATLSEGTVMGTLPDDGSAVTQDMTIYRVSNIKKGNVAGKVLGPDGVTPRAGVIVIVEAPNYKNWLRTGADGGYAFTGVYAGGVTITVRDDATGEKSSVSGTVVDAVTSVFNVILKGTGTVTGQVQRGDGKSAEGLYIVASYSDYPVLRKIVLTDQDGNFKFDALPVTNISIEVLDPHDFNKTVVSGSVTLLSAGDTANVYLYVPNTALSTGTIKGTVHKGDGSVWANADIRYVIDNWRYRPYKADAQGNFIIPDLPLGNHTLVAINGKDVINATINIWYGSQVKTVDLYTVPMGTVTGNTYDDEAKTMPTGADVTLISMKPNPMGILAYDSSSPTVVKSDPQTGKYTFTGVYAGNFTVSSSNIFRPTPVSKSGVLTPDNLTATVDLALKGSVNTGPVNTMGSISGKVLLPDGTPSGEGVRVTATFGGADVTVTTDGSGNFHFTPIIPSGNNRVTAEDPVTTLKWQGNVSVPAGQDVPVTIKLLGRGSLVVKALNADGTPAPGTSIDVKGVGYPQDSASGSTSSDGTIRFDNLTEGRYAVSALGSFGRGGRNEGTIPVDKAVVNVDVKLAPSGTVTGRFLKPDGVAPVPGGQVKLLNSGRQVVAYAVASSDPANLGQFRMEYVPLGDFTLEGYDPTTERMGMGGGRLSTDGEAVTSNLIVTPRGTVKGTVLNYSGVAPVPNAPVSISVTGVADFRYNTVSGVDGGFIFAGVPSGRFNISAADPSNGLVGQASGSISYEGETAQATVNIAPTGSIAGRVLLPDGITPALNSLVSLSGISGNMPVDQTTGGFSYSNLAAGRSYTLFAYETSTHRAGKTIVTIQSDGEVAPADITMRGIGAIQGKVFDADGLTLLAGAMVRIQANGLVSASYTDYTDENGGYKFTDVPAGSFTLQASHPQRTTGSSASGVLNNDNDNLAINLTLAPVASVTGKVLLADGATPARGGVVVFNGSGRNFTSLIDTNGVFIFNSIPIPCSFSLYVEDANGLGIGKYSGTLNVNGQLFDVGTIVLDDKPVTVTDVLPAPGSVDVPVNQAVKIRFSEAVKPSTVSSSTIYLMQGNSKVSGTLLLDSDNRGVTLTPSALLSGFTLYTIIVSTDVTDLVDRRVPQTFSSSFTTVDNVPPVIKSVSPVNGTIQAASDTVVRITFSESIDPAFVDGIKLTLNGTPVETRLDLINAGTVAVLTPFSPLMFNSTYGISVIGIKDTVGNLMSGASSSFFNTIDTIAPTISSLSVPASADLIKGNTVVVTANVMDADAALVDFFVNDQLAATDTTAPYSYNLLLAAEGAIGVKAVAQDKAGNRGLPVSLSMDVKSDASPVIAITSPGEGSSVNTGATFAVGVQATDDLYAKEITLTTSGALTSTQTKSSTGGKAFNTSFNLTVPTDASNGGDIRISAVVKDSGGNTSPIAQRTVYVHDSILPTVALTSPGQSVRYKPGEVGAATVTAGDSNGVMAVNCTYTGSPSGLTLPIVQGQKSVVQAFNFQVPADAAPDAKIDISCTATDAAGNSGNKTVSIYVADVVPPVITWSSIADNAVNIPTGLSASVLFSEPLAQATVNASSIILQSNTGQNVPVNVTLSTDHRTIMLSSTATLSTGTLYKLTISGSVTDEAGNRMGNDYLLNFTTDGTPPSIISVTPANDSKDIFVSSLVIVRFNEPIDSSTVTGSSLVLTSAGVVVQGSFSMNQDNTIVTFKPSQQLAFNTDYTVTVKAGIKDLSGNATASDYVSVFKTQNFGEALKAVYYDPSYPTTAITRAKGLIYKNFLSANGFIVMNASQLKTFMQNNAAGSIVVMAQDVAPDTVADVQSSDSIIRKYLNAGGTVIWMQDAPLYYQGHSDGTTTNWGVSGAQNVLSISAGNWNVNDTVTITSDGSASGLGQMWTSNRPVQASQVTKVYASSSGGAAAWFKNYNPSYPNSGFVRIWDSYTGDYTNRWYLRDLLTIVGMNNGAIVYPDLVALYHMDGDWTDSSGNNFNGTAYNGVSFSSDSKLGSFSGSFDGVDDAVSIMVDIPEMNFTIEAWAKTGSPGGLFSVNSGNYTGSTGNDRHMYVNGSGYACFRVWQGGGWCTSKKVNDNIWHHWALVVEKNVGQKVYIDGQLVGTNSYDHSDFNWQDRITIGYSADGGYFKGLIDEVAVRRYALPIEDVLEHYNAGLSPDRTPPLPPTVNPVSSPTYSNTVTLSGTKDIDASIRVNGVQIVPVDSSTTWQGFYSLQELGQNQLRITSRDAFGNESEAVTISATLLSANQGDVSLVGLWHLDGNWIDQSGNGNHMTPSIDAGFSADAKVGTQSGKFTGSTYANRSSVSGLPLGNSPRTMMAWIKPYSYPDTTYNGIIGYGPMSCGQGSILSIKNDGRLSMAFWCNDAYQTTGPAVALNQWNHVALTYDGGTMIKFYINGQFVQEVQVSAKSVANTQNGPLRIGSTDNPGKLFNGLIDEVAIYNRALSAADMLEHYNSYIVVDSTPPGVPTANPVSSPASSDTITLFGTKDADTSIRVNGVQLVPVDSSTSWQATYALPKVGDNLLTITSRDIVGNQSPSVTVSVTLQTMSAHWWPGEGNANDIAGNNTGIVTTEFSGTVGFPSGKVGQGFDFNGANFVEIPQIPLNDFTIDLWLNQRTRSTSTDFGAVIISNEVCGTVDDWHIGLIADGRLFTLIGDSQGSRNVSYISNGTIPLNVYTHIALTRSTSTGQVKLYINGVLDGTYAAPHNRIIGASNPVCDTGNHQNKIGIGNLRRQAILNGKTYAFDGIIDEPEMTNRVLSAAEIQSIYNTGDTDKAPPILTITSPLNQAYVNGSSITVTGTATDVLSGIGSITVNGVNAAITGDNYYANITLQDGANTITVKSTDIAGNSTTASVGVVLDTFPPTLTIASPSNQASLHTSSITVTGTTSDALSGINTVTVNGNTATITGNTYSGNIVLQEGSNTVAVKSTDKVGNFTTASVVVIVDTTPPTLTITSPSNQAYLKSSSITVTGNVADLVSGVGSVSVNGVSATITDSIYSANITLQEGANTITVTAADREGNSRTVSSTVNLDAATPTGSIFINSGAAYTNKTSATLSLTCNDSGSGCGLMQLSGDNATWSAPESYSSYKDWTLTPGDGQKSVYVKYADKAGNWSAAYSASIKLDTLPPVFTSVFPLASSSVNNSSVGYTLNKNVTEGSIAFIWAGGLDEDISIIRKYDFTASDMTAGDHHVNTGFSLISGNSYTVVFDAMDASGNKAETVSHTMTYDDTPVLIDIKSPVTNAKINNANVTYSLSEDISKGDIVYTWIGGNVDAASPHRYPLSHSDKKMGFHSINTGFNLVDGAIYNLGFENATDQAGNASPYISNSNIRYDITSVAITGTTPTANSSISHATVNYTLSEYASEGKVTFTWTGGTSDSASPHVYELAADALTAGPHAVNTYLRLVDGAIYTVSFDAADYAGNPATTVSNAIIKFDATAPVVAITSHADGSTVSTGTITVSGTIDDNTATVTINGVPAIVSQNTFTADIALVQGYNRITASASDMSENVSSNTIMVYLSSSDISVVISNLMDGSSVSLSSPQVIVGQAVSSVPLRPFALVSENGMVVTGIPLYQIGPDTWMFNSGIPYINFPTQDGRQVLTVTVTDFRGNTGSSSVTVFYTQ